MGQLRGASGTARRGGGGGLSERPSDGAGVGGRGLTAAASRATSRDGAPTRAMAAPAAVIQVTVQLRVKDPSDGPNYGPLSTAGGEGKEVRP